MPEPELSLCKDNLHFTSMNLGCELGDQNEELKIRLSSPNGTSLRFHLLFDPV